MFWLLNFEAFFIAAVINTLNFDEAMTFMFP